MEQVSVELINSVIRTNGCTMFEVTKGKLLLLDDHYKYIDWYPESRRVLIGTTQLPEGCYYLPNPIKVLSDCKRYPGAYQVRKSKSKLVKPKISPK